MNDLQHARSMAVFCDFENIALGARDMQYAKFDMAAVLERLLLRGNLVVRKAYCDWDRYKEYKRAMHEASFELIEIPHVRQSGKNSADIRLVVDALDLCYTKPHLDTFVIISGDSDFSPLVSKLRENNRLVVGVGVRQSTSDLLTAICDEFIFYDDLVREREQPARKRRRTRTKSDEGDPRGNARPDSKADSKADAKLESKPESKPGSKAGSKAESKAESKADSRAGAKTGTRAAGKSGSKAKAANETAAKDDAGRATAGRADGPGDDDRSVEEAIDWVVEIARALLDERGDEEKVWGSMVKQTLRRRRPGFNERAYGFSNFGALLDEAASRGAISLQSDSKSGGQIIEDVPS